jgi:Ni/Co efflux regulator RcnB
MKKMLLLTAALIAALAGPALAQDRRPGGAVGNGSRSPEAAQMQRGGDRGDFRGRSGARDFSQRGQAAQPNFNRQRDFGQRSQAAQPNVQREFNRGDANRFTQRDGGTRDFNRGGSNRLEGRRDFNRGDNRFDGNRNNFRRDNDRRDFGRFDGRRDYGRNDYRDRRYSQYYRSFNAQRRFRVGSYYRPSGWYYRRWTYGDYLPSLFWSSRYWLNDYYAYDLTPPLPGTIWVRYGDDALLIDQYTGEVIQVAYGIFW